MNQIHIDHKAYQRKVKGYSDDQLWYVIKDAREAAEANPQGPKAGYYYDEIHYCAAELRRRGIR